MGRKIRRGEWLLHPAGYAQIDRGQSQVLMEDTLSHPALSPPAVPRDAAVWTDPDYGFEPIASTPVPDRFYPA
jgi:hypothetical protein